ncbi:unnamed protein product [Coregonus sp. 'balchen']|nr:unnamed protein product [Coregonus sp. 'balchen']
MSGSNNNIDEMVTTITDYIKFCIHCVIPMRTTRIKNTLRMNKIVFSHRDMQSLRQLNSSLKHAIQRAKLRYKDKVEEESSNKNAKQAFEKVRKLADYSDKPSPLAHDDPFAFSNDLNHSSHFNTHDFSEDCEHLLDALHFTDSPAHSSLRRRWRYSCGKLSPRQRGRGQTGYRVES